MPGTYVPTSTAPKYSREVKHWQIVVFGDLCRFSLKCFYYLNQNENPKTREYRIRIQMANNPAQHVDRATVLWSSDLLFRAHNPPPVS
jgi:hypothetical protein